MILGSGLTLTTTGWAYTAVGSAYRCYVNSRTDVVDVTIGART